MGIVEFIATARIAGAIGTLLGIVSTFILEWTRWRREDRTRFRSDLYQRCVDLYVASVMWHGRGYMRDHERPDLDEWALFDGLVMSLSHIRMIAGGELADAATRLVSQCVENDPVDDPEDDERDKALEDLREAFNEAARKELGVEVDPGAVRRVLTRYRASLEE